MNLFADEALHRNCRPICVLPALFLCLQTVALAGESDRYFAIRIIDESTGRGVPLVELKTVNNIRFYTDSNGIIAFHEPGLMNRWVWFSIQGHGYEVAANGFGQRGAAFLTKPGGSTTWKIKRKNIAERLYRITGGGIYRDSLLVGDRFTHESVGSHTTARVPIQNSSIHALVLGCDSVMNAVYRDRIYWFWGDTHRPKNPLGNFHVPGATSSLPSDGGLDPEQGINFNYFIGKDGFAAETCRMKGDGPTWITSLLKLTDPRHGERLFAIYVKIRPPLNPYRRGLAEFDPESNQFKHICDLPLTGRLPYLGHTFEHVENGIKYIYFAGPLPLSRVRADVESLKNPAAHESFTCLESGSRIGDEKIERDSLGNPVYAWKKDTQPLQPIEQHQWLRRELLKPREAVNLVNNVETGNEVILHAGSVFWNEHREKWVLIATETYGKQSFLGEVWYSEAAAPHGPWRHARKIVTHDKYSFYNPKQHPMFSKENGRIIYFEGTYCTTFSGNDHPTPRYDYNQIMYKLDLSDKRLKLPADEDIGAK